jgi:hypothetical protein
VTPDRPGPDNRGLDARAAVAAIGDERLADDVDSHGDDRRRHGGNEGTGRDRPMPASREKGTRNFTDASSHTR